MEVDDSQADIVVMCTHGRSGLGRFIYGSVAEGVIRRSRVPVLLVRPTGAEDIAAPRQSETTQTTGIPGWIGSCRSHPAGLIDLAETVKGELVLLHVEDPSNPDPSPVLSVPESTGNEPVVHLEAYLAGVKGSVRHAGIPVRTEVRFGSPAGAILAAERSSGVGLVAMATHGRSDPLEPITGSVAREVILKGDLPVLLARPTGVQDNFNRASSVEGNWNRGLGNAAHQVERVASAKFSGTPRSDQKVTHDRRAEDWMD